MRIYSLKAKLHHIFIDSTIIDNQAIEEVCTTILWDIKSIVQRWKSVSWLNSICSIWECKGFCQWILSQQDQESLSIQYQLPLWDVMRSTGTKLLKSHNFKSNHLNHSSNLSHLLSVNIVGKIGLIVNWWYRKENIWKWLVWLPECSGMPAQWGRWQDEWSSGWFWGSYVSRRGSAQLVDSPAPCHLLWYMMSWQPLISCDLWFHDTL